MLELKIVVEMPGIPEAINHLADALSARNLPAAKPATTKAAKAEKKAAEKVTEPDSAPAVEAKPEVVPAAPTVQPPVEPATPAETAPAVPAVPAVPTTATEAPTAAGQTVPAAPAPARVYSLDELSHAGAALISKGKMQELIGLLSVFGVKALTQIPPERYGELAEKLMALDPSCLS